MKFLKKKISAPVSPLMMTGVLVVLLPVFAFMTLDRMEKQEEHIRERVLVRGISLIRTFEAGTRTGMLTMQWGGQRIQAMLQETAVQDDIAYIMITDANGRILAHSDPEKVGSIYSGLPDITPATREIQQENHRKGYRVFNRTRTVDGEPVFEVYKRFAPMKMGFQRRHSGMHDMHGRDKDDFHRGKKGGFGRYGGPGWKEFSPGFFQQEEHYIFAGLSMVRVEALQKRKMRDIIGRGLLFFTLGCAGIICLFAFQAYRSAKTSLDRVRAFTDNVIQNMPSGLITLDPDYKVTSANRAARDILGALPDKAYPRMIELALEMKESKTVVTREVGLKVFDNEEVRLDMTASPILDDEARIQGFIFLFRDLTQLAALKKEVETNRRLAAIGKLAGGVAHEIRNPLSSIKGFATYFAKRYENEADDAETARIMVQEVERINRSITQLLEFAKPMAVEEKPVALKPLIRHSLKLVSHDLEKKAIRSEIRVNTRLEQIKTDPDRINQVLLNLYMNAINAMEDQKGELIVEVRDNTEDGKVEIRVTDNGCGIAPKDLEEIYDPYFTTRPDGTGLGLSIVHRIVENLRGEIRVESAPGEGAAFIVRLPGSGADGE
ncbi:MAG: ATP-binding protein [Desulfobacterales bacterium]|nr:ATP-binding protein [Desulfobacterales bacterium]